MALHKEEAMGVVAEVKHFKKTMIKMLLVLISLITVAGIV